MDKAIINKIRLKVSEVEWACNSNGLSEQGANEQMYNFRIAVHKKFPNLLFVVCNKDIYQGRSLKGKKFWTMAFDSATGDAVANFDISTCGVNFFDEVTFGQKIL